MGCIVVELYRGQPTLETRARYGRQVCSEIVHLGYLALALPTGVRVYDLNLQIDALRTLLTDLQVLRDRMFQSKHYKAGP